MLLLQVMQVASGNATFGPFITCWTPLLLSVQEDDGSLWTLFCEAKYIVNSHLLTVDGISYPKATEPLNPNHLIIMKSKAALTPPGKFVKEAVCCLSCSFCPSLISVSYHQLYLHILLPFLSPFVSRSIVCSAKLVRLSPGLSICYFPFYFDSPLLMCFLFLLCFATFCSAVLPGVSTLP